LDEFCTCHHAVASFHAGGVIGLVELRHVAHDVFVHPGAEDQHQLLLHDVHGVVLEQIVGLDGDPLLDVAHVLLLIVMGLHLHTGVLVEDATRLTDFVQVVHIREFRRHRYRERHCHQVHLEVLRVVQQ